MTKKIGFIDLHIDEWHANNYTGWFRACKNFEGFELGYAWEEYPNPDGKDLKTWCTENGMIPAASIEEVIEKSDVLCVLAPSNPEAHERLADLALRSGKPLYIDKTFAPDKATAEKFFAIAAEHGTPLMSSSALRYGEELTTALAEHEFNYVSTFGGGRTFDEYSIHQIEMIVATLGTGAVSVERVMHSETPHYIVRYPDDRSATMTYGSFGFSAILAGKGCNAFPLEGTRMFDHLLEHILDFYKTGVSPIPAEQTIEVAAIREAALKAEQAPGTLFRV